MAIQALAAKEATRGELDASQDELLLQATGSLQIMHTRVYSSSRQHTRVFACASKIPGPCLIVALSLAT